MVSPRIHPNTLSECLPSCHHQHECYLERLGHRMEWDKGCCLEPSEESYRHTISREYGTTRHFGRKEQPTHRPLEHLIRQLQSGPSLVWPHRRAAGPRPHDCRSHENCRQERMEKFADRFPKQPDAYHWPRGKSRKPVLTYRLAHRRQATVAFVAITLQASAALRHAFYETFLHLHIALVILSLVFLWKHLEDTHPQKYLLAMIILWALERFARLTSLIYRNVGRGGTKAELELLPGDACRVTLKMVRPWTFQPGQYVFITVPSVGLWTSHPFSLAWSSSGVDDMQQDSEKGYKVFTDDILANSNDKTSMSLIIRRRSGFTDKLFEKAERSTTGITTISAYVEGPYGGHAVLHSYGTVMIFAGGVGITHQVPFVRDLVAGYASGTVAARKVILVWVIQSPEHLEWIRPWMTTILAMDKRRDVLRIQLFVTRPRSTKEIHSPSATVQMFPGKPNVDTLIEMESENQIGAMGVSVCGTGGLSDDVRAAVRRRQGVRNIDFLEQGFTW